MPDAGRFLLFGKLLTKAYGIYIFPHGGINLLPNHLKRKGHETFCAYSLFVVFAVHGNGLLKQANPP
jgi:hypothetical protein